MLMRAMLNKLMDDISRWAKLQEESYATLDKLTSIIRELLGDKVSLADPPLIRAGSAPNATC
jgi:hypothetical protein